VFGLLWAGFDVFVIMNSSQNAQQTPTNELGFQECLVAKAPSHEHDPHTVQLGRAVAEIQNEIIADLSNPS